MMTESNPSLNLLPPLLPIIIITSSFCVVFLVAHHHGDHHHFCSSQDNTFHTFHAIQDMMVGSGALSGE